MPELESQIAKIQLGNTKSSNLYVFTMAEKAEGGDAELYVVAEIPLMNPAAKESCEKICLAIGSTLKKAYKRSISPATFENAISQINEELGKLASMGQTHWIDKLNCIIAVKAQKTLTIASTGKVSCFLLRGGEFTDISCSSEKTHPLKTFENYASGKIKLGDLVILSSMQLFNYLSMDRLKSLVEETGFLDATQTIINILKDNAGPETAFATLLNLQVPLGQAAEEQVDLENYMLENPEAREPFLAKIGHFAKSVFALDRRKRSSAIAVPKTSFSNRLKKISGSTKTVVNKGQGAFKSIKNGFRFAKQKLDLGNFGNFSTQKKFFLGSAAFLLLAFVVNIIIASIISGTQKNQAEISGKLETAQSLISDAESSILYKDETSAKNYLTEAWTNLNLEEKELNEDNQKFYAETIEKFNRIKQSLEKVVQVEAEAISNLGDAQNLIVFPGNIATQINGNILSFNIETGQLIDGLIKSPQTITTSASVSSSNSVVYNNGALFVWDRENGTTAAAFENSVPSSENAVGLDFYPPNSRVYSIDKEKGQVISFVVVGESLGRPIASITSNTSDLKTAQDLAIDGNIYILSGQGITKYRSGSPAEFNEPGLITPLSGQGKLYTEVDYNYLYVLDKGNQRIVVLDSDGTVVQTLASDKLTNPSDFYVDEPNKVIYVLNEGALLRIEIP